MTNMGKLNLCNVSELRTVYEMENKTL